MTATFGIVESLVLCTASVIVAGRTIDCLAGKLAWSTATVNVSSGSLASWRVPPPQPDTSAAQAPSMTAMYG